MRGLLSMLALAVALAVPAVAVADEPEVRGEWWTMNVTNTIGGVHRLREYSAERFDVWGRRGKAHLKFAQTDVLRRVDRDWSPVVRRQGG